MPPPPGTPAFLFHPDSFIFPTNRPYAEHFQEAGGRLVQLSTGHYVVYGNHGRRLLLADPDGYPLHECEWRHEPKGRDVLTRTRVRLDSGLWVGLKPGGLTNATALNLSSKPGWERLRADDLRNMAAHAMHVPMDEVRFFYGEEDLQINAQGIATIRHRKDALYLLEQGRFEGARFMACMGAMHWDTIDFLPVVELFQSLVPGTGSAIFELIRGLYDDQNAGQANPRPLRYRGIPTYPSEAAFRLFSAFFTPRSPGGGDPFALFMNAQRSPEVIWSPADDCPHRYVGDAGRVCVTVKRRRIEKLTFSDDHTGLPYMAPIPGRPAPCERTVLVSNREVLLFDRRQERTLPVNSQWGPLDETNMAAPPSPTEVSWTSLFKGPLPQVTGSQAFSAVLLYPEDAEEISELSSQPFVMDYIQDLLEPNVPLSARLTRARRVLVNRFDGVISGCIDHTGLRQYTIVYLSDRFAQKQAQTLWNRFAAVRRLADLRQIAMYRGGDEPQDDHHPYDVLYEWIPFAQYDKASDLKQTLATLLSKMATGATAFVAGPATLPTYLSASTPRIEVVQPVEAMTSFRMHQSILPHACLKPGLTFFCLHRP